MIAPASRRAVALVVAATLAVAAPLPALSRGPSVADVDAAARAEGNRRPLAIAIGRAIFVRDWPAQVLKVRVDGIDANAVASLDVSAVKFHARLDLRAFEDEIASLARAAFAAAPIDEVDVVAVQPLKVGERAVVSGDLAQPTNRIVFTVTVRRPELDRLPGRLHSETDVFIAPDFRARLNA